MDIHESSNSFFLRAGVQKLSSDDSAANLRFFSFSKCLCLSCCTIKEKAVGSYGWLGLGTGMRGPQVKFLQNIEGLEAN